MIGLTFIHLDFTKYNSIGYNQIPPELKQILSVPTAKINLNKESPFGWNSNIKTICYIFELFNRSKTEEIFIYYYKQKDCIFLYDSTQIDMKPVELYLLSKELRIE